MHLEALKLEQQRILPCLSVKILPVKEIAAMKAYTLGRRGTFKDYVDLYFILKDGHATLEEIKGIAKKI